MQSSLSTAFLCTESRNVLLARPWFLRRLSLKDGSIDMFEIDCLTKHIAKFPEPTEEQQTKLKVLTELRAVLNNLSANGKAIPLMKELLKVEPVRANVSAPYPNKQVAKPNSPAPVLNRRASDMRINTTRTTAGAAASAPASTIRPPVTSVLPKAPATASAVASARTTAGKPMPGRSEKKPTATNVAAQAVPVARSTHPAGKNAHPLVNHFLNKLGESANPPSEKATKRTAAPALPLSAALASHQCSIR